MQVHSDVSRLLNTTYALLVNDDGSLKPRSGEEMGNVAWRLRELESRVTTADDCLKFEALRRLFDMHCRRSWHPSLPAMAWATLLAGASILVAGEFPVWPAAMATWWTSGVVLHVLTSYYPNYLARDVSFPDRPRRPPQTPAFRVRLTTGLREALILPITAITDLVTRSCAANRFD